MEAAAGQASTSGLYLRPGPRTPWCCRCCGHASFCCLRIYFSDLSCRSTTLPLILSPRTYLSNFLSLHLLSCYISLPTLFSLSHSEHMSDIHKARSWLPDPIGGRLWLGPHDAMVVLSGAVRACCFRGILMG